MPILIALAGLLGYAILKRTNVPVGTPPSSPTQGQIWQYTTPDGRTQFATWNGSAWVDLVR